LREVRASSGQKKQFFKEGVPRKDKLPKPGRKNTGEQHANCEREIGSTERRVTAQRGKNRYVGKSRQKKIRARGRRTLGGRRDIQGEPGGHCQIPNVDSLKGGGSAHEGDTLVHLDKGTTSTVSAKEKRHEGKTQEKGGKKRLPKRKNRKNRNRPQPKKKNHPGEKEKTRPALKPVGHNKTLKNTRINTPNTKKSIGIGNQGKEKGK